MCEFSDSNYDVSIVVPAYNTKKYLNKCVDSLLGQTLQNLEIIIVDDGSTDGSSIIVDEYASQHERIKVIHQKNQGLGSARNSGILIARGEYIGFVDSDDWVDPRMFEKLFELSKMHDADICYSGLSYKYDNNVSIDVIHPLAGKTIKSAEEINAFHCSMYGTKLNDYFSDEMPISSWNALYKKDYLHSNKILFKNMRSEDRDFNIRCTRRAGCIVFDDGCFYCYRKEGQSSITNGVNKRSIFECMHLIDSLFVEVGNESPMILEDCAARIDNTAMDIFLDLLRSIVMRVEDQAEKEELLHALIAESIKREFLNADYINNKNIRKRILYSSINCFGLNFATVLLEMEMRLYKAKTMIEQVWKKSNFGSKWV